MQSAKAFQLRIYLPKKFRNVYLRYFVLSLKFELVLKLHHILEESAEFDPS